MVKAAVLLALAACGAARPRAPHAHVLDGSDVTLYRDGALVQQQVEVDVPAGGVASVRLRIPAGVEPDHVHALPRAGVEVLELRQASAVPPPLPPDLNLSGTALSLELSDEAIAALQRASQAEEWARNRPGELELVVRAPPGRAAVRLGYITDRLTWEVAYTLTANASRDRAVLRGAVAIRNASRVALPAAKVRLIDSSLADARAYAADALASRFVDRKPGDKPPPPRELGRLDLADGETRVELVRDPVPRAMRSVLVYDPIGTQYDRGGRVPAMEADLGVRPPAGSRVDESFEFSRDAGASAGLPEGPVRLLERRADGSLALLGEARLFEASTRGSHHDTITVGTAAGVIGERERHDLTVDRERQRVVEEFVITIANERPGPVEVVLREHLYRGTNWTLAYLSVPWGDETKQGPQQVAPRLTVPPRAKGRVMYSVVYWW